MRVAGFTLTLAELRERTGDQTWLMAPIHIVDAKGCPRRIVAIDATSTGIELHVEADDAE